MDDQFTSYTSHHKGTQYARRRRALERIDAEIFTLRCFLALVLTERRSELLAAVSRSEAHRLSAEILQLEGVIDRIAEMTPDERRLSYAWRVLGAKL